MNIRILMNFAIIKLNILHWVGKELNFVIVQIEL